MKVSPQAQAYVDNSTCSHFWTVEKDNKRYPAYSNGLTNFAVIEDGENNKLEQVQSEYTDDTFLPHLDFPRNGYRLIGMGLIDCT